MRKFTRRILLGILLAAIPMMVHAVSLTFTEGSRYVTTPNGHYVKGAVSVAANQYVCLYDSAGKLRNYSKVSGRNFSIALPTLKKGDNIFYVRSLKSGNVDKSSLYKIRVVYTDFSVKRRRMHFCAVGQSLNVKATGATSYSSSNPKVATVDRYGNVVSKGPGNAVITVWSGGQSAKVYVAVPKIRERKAALSPWYDAMKVQREFAYNAEANWGDWRNDIASSKKYGTCITTPSVVAMRCKLVKQGSYFTGTGKYNDSPGQIARFWDRAVGNSASINKRYWTLTKISTTVSGGKTTKSLIKSGKIKEGDIVGGDGHAYIYCGKYNGGYKYFESNVGNGNRPKFRIGTNDNRKVVSVFSPNTFVIYTTCVNGAISPSNMYMAGQNVKISFAGLKGKTIDSIKVDGKVVSNRSSYTFKNLDRNHRVTVVYK